MSNSSLSFKQQRKLVFDFIKTHADSFYGITKTFINKLENADKDEFIRLIKNIKLSSGCHYNVFTPSLFRNNIYVWITDSAVDDVSEWEQNGFFKNITTVRMSNLERLFAIAYKKKDAKKPFQSKTKKTGNAVKVRHKIAFIDVKNESIQHAMNAGGNTLDLCCNNKSECGDHNQIDHVINAYNCAINEFRNIVTSLAKARDKGATHVIDSTYTKPEHFGF